MSTLDVAAPATWAGHILAARRLRAVMALALLYLLVVDLLYGVLLVHVPIYILNGYVIGDATSRIRNYRVLENGARREEEERGAAEGSPPPPPDPTTAPPPF